MTRRRALVMLLGLVLAPRAASAGRGRSVRMRMEGYVGPPPEGRNEQADLELRAGKKDIRFQVTKAMLLSGGGLAADVFDRIAPYKPSFILRGPSEFLDRMTVAAPGTRLVISGQWLPPARDFLVGAIEPGSAAP